MAPYYIENVIFRYQENKLRMQRSLALQITPRGNVRGKRVKNEIEINTSPMKKKKKIHQVHI